ncbi:MAG TPA: type I glyceraldehyde-3-phosphate dehydrogenase [Planctomycetota bacterium]|nr:type I glyceraldehyde-3-phosphate dehydrogenase [Planctomycetota bacterium]
MAIRIGINGFGRIGRNVFRIMWTRPQDFEIVAINDLTDPAGLAHLLKYDSVFGRFDHKVTSGAGALTVDGKSIKVLAEKDPAKLPWKDLNVDCAVESTGVFSTKADCQKHIAAGAKKVLLTVPPKDEVDRMVVMGVNDETLLPTDQILSNASCTTNCVAPVAKVLHQKFGIDHGFMTTVHAYTNDQRVSDLIHKDLRRARAAAINIIPTSTGAARAVGKVLPDLKGKLDGTSLRVPVPDGSIVDLVCELESDATKESVNAAFKAAASGPMKNVLEYTEDEIVSSDVIGNSHSAIFDAKSTMMLGARSVKVFAWYDNEFGYSSRVCDLIKLAHSKK